MKPWMKDLAMSAATLLVVAVLACTPYDEPLIVLMPAIIVAAYVGGLRTGMITTATATACVTSVIPASDPIGLTVLRISALVVSGALVSVVCGMLLRAKRRAERSERDYSESFHASPVALVLVDAEHGRFIDVNEAYLKLCGYAREELIGKTSDEVGIAPADEVERLTRWVRRSGLLRDAPTTVRRKDGMLRDVLTSAVTIDAAPASRRVVTVVDVTEHKKAVTNARESKERFAELANTIDEIFWITDVTKQHMLYISPAYERTWGRACESLYANPMQWLDAVHPDDRARVMANALPGPNQAAGSLEFRIIRPSGEVRWIRNKSFKICDTSGAVVRMAGVATDITDARKLELELQQAQKMESLGRLAGGVAHDFNNVLAVISTNASIMSDLMPPTGEEREMMGEIEHAVSRASGLTRQLLAFSRKQNAEAVVLDINATITETRKMLRRMIGEDITLETSLDPDLPHVMIDPGHLVQVVMNLAVNARDAMPHGGLLHLQTRMHVNGNKMAVLIVRDSGTGMTPEVKARVFEPFFTTKGTGKGTGMGLAVVHGIVQQAGGKIEIQSELGQGTTFYIYLPATDAPLDDQQENSGALPRGLENVLVVDDDPHVRQATLRALRNIGYNAMAAADGPSALRTLATSKVDLLVTDVVMPGMNGRELAETARVARPNLKVLYVSGYTDDEVVARGVMRGDVDLLDKPFAADKLALKVREVLDAGA